MYINIYIKCIYIYIYNIHICICIELGRYLGSGNRSRSRSKTCTVKRRREKHTSQASQEKKQRREKVSLRHHRRDTRIPENITHDSLSESTFGKYTRDTRAFEDSKTKLQNMVFFFPFFFAWVVKPHLHDWTKWLVRNQFFHVRLKGLSRTVADLLFGRPTRR